MRGPFYVLVGALMPSVLIEGGFLSNSGEARLLDFGVSDNQAWDVGLACGGKIQIFVERLN